MLNHLKENWRQLKRGEAGHRFIERYQRRKASAKGGGFNFRRLANIGLGLLITAAGVFFLPAPGPGTVVLLVGLALLGSEVKFIARFLDWAEVRLRKLARWSRATWKRLPAAVKALAIAIVVALLAGAGYTVSWWLSK